MTIMTMPDALAAAVEAERAPRERVADLSVKLDAALASQSYDAAAQLQPTLNAARGDLAMAEAASRALREGGQAVEAQRAADAEKIQAAQRKNAAAGELNAATVDEARAMRQIDEAIEEMRTALEVAQRAFRTAQAFETTAGQARVRALETRRQLGEWPAGHPGPKVSKPNKASVLVDQDPLIHALAAWRR